MHRKGNNQFNQQNKVMFYNMGKTCSKLNIYHTHTHTHTPTHMKGNLGKEKGKIVMEKVREGDRQANVNKVQ